jgi:hypothetical protein
VEPLAAGRAAGALLAALLCAYIGTLSHPALDWLNSYGIRLLEPFSSTWYAGDTLFIIDVWIWATLIGCWWWSRRREKRGGDWQRPAWLGFAAIGAYIFANGLITGMPSGPRPGWSPSAAPSRPGRRQPCPGRLLAPHDAVAGLGVLRFGALFRCFWA